MMIVEIVLAISDKIKASPSGKGSIRIHQTGIYFAFLLIREQLIATNKPIKIHGNAAPIKSLTILHSSSKFFRLESMMG